MVASPSDLLTTLIFFPQLSLLKPPYSVLRSSQRLQSSEEKCIQTHATFNKWPLEVREKPNHLYHISVRKHRLCFGSLQLPLSQ